MLRPTMLRFVLACCDRLAGALTIDYKVVPAFVLMPAIVGKKCNIENFFSIFMSVIKENGL